ncbi:ATP-dependent DNA helicase [Trichonephila clavipes]|nr:ATP-dependent DNA helicase [Trichonephila clavipes]
MLNIWQLNGLLRHPNSPKLGVFSRRLLFHQFLVDMYGKLESECLRFIALNQTKLRAENYTHLQDAIRNDADLDPNNLGQMDPTNFLDLKTVEGQELETFRQVCEKLGLLEDNNHWDATIEEAVLCRAPSQIRKLFAILICTCGLSNPLQLWDKYKVALSEDILHRFERMGQVNNDLYLNEALRHVEDKIIRISGKKLSDFGMPTPQRRGELSTDLIKKLS